MNPPLNFEPRMLDVSEFCERYGVLYRRLTEYDTKYNYPAEAIRDGRTWKISEIAADHLLRDVKRLPKNFTGVPERITLTHIGEELDVYRTRLTGVLLNEDTRGFFYKQLYPVLMAEVTGDGVQCRAFCHFCNKFHLHGNGDGHRAAHCFTANSPYKKTGYILYRVPKLPKQPQRWPVKRPSYGGPLATCPVELLNPVE